MKITILDDDGTLLATARVGGLSVNQNGSVAIDALVISSLSDDGSPGIKDMSAIDEDRRERDNSVQALIDSLVRTGRTTVGWPS